MLRTQISSLMIVALCSTASYAGVFSDSSSQFFYRHMAADGVVEISIDEKAADVTANFTGFIGEGFSEKIPVITSEFISSWEVISGDLPAGLQLDSATGTLQGSVSGGGEETYRILLQSFNAEGKELDVAAVTIDVFDPSLFTGVPFEFYGRVGRYNFEQLPVASGVDVDYWRFAYDPPPGISINQRNFEGTPQDEGNYPIIAIGFDYLNNVASRLRGDYLVETNANFDDIPDQLFDIPANPGFITFDIKPEAQRTIHSSGDVSKIRYSVEIDPDDTLPPGLSIDAISGTIEGAVRYPHYSARVRFKAIDVDSSIGYSNWFEIGTKEAQLSFTGVFDEPFFAIVDEPFSLIFETEGSAGDKVYSIASGTLPNGLSLNTETGEISGTSTAIESQESIVLRLEVTNAGITDIIETNPFDINVKLDDIYLRVSDRSPDPSNIRAGSAFSVTLSADGPLLEPYSIALSEDSELPQGTSFNPSTGVFSGSISASGPSTTNFVLTNGDGQKDYNGITLNVFDPLSIDNVPDITVAQYDSAEEIMTVSYNTEGVMPSDDGSSVPVFSISPALPNGMDFDEWQGIISGGSTDGVGLYGPFTISIQDGSGDIAHSNQFSIDVTPRLGMTIDIKDVEFTYNIEDTKSPIHQLDRPPLAEDLNVVFTLEEGVLPNGFALNSSDGSITGVSSAIGVTSGLRIKATDEEGYEAVSDLFSLEVSPPDDILQKATEPVITTVGYPVDIPALEFANTLGEISYEAVDALPSGLSIDETTGIIIGQTNELVEATEYTIEVTDEEGRTGTGILNLTVVPRPVVSLGEYSSPIQISRLADVDIQLVAENILGGAVFELNSGDLPPLTAISQDGKIIGTTDVEAVYEDIVISVTDDKTGFVGLSEPITIIVGPREDLSISYAENVDIYNKLSVNLPMRPTLDSADGDVLFEIDSGILPNGLELDPATGYISGAPQENGFFDITIIGTDEAGYTDTADILITATPVHAIIQMPDYSFGYRVGESFDTGSINIANHVPPVEFTTNDALPSGVLLSSSDGALFGAATQSGEYEITVSAEDSMARETERSSDVNLIIHDNIEIVAQPENIITNKYSDKFGNVGVTVANAIGDVSYSLQGTLPNGLVFDTQTGVISGIATGEQVASGLTITVLDDYDNTTDVSDPFSITVDEELPLIATLPSEVSTITGAEIGNIASVEVDNAAYGQVLSYTLQGTLPGGISFDSNEGRFYGEARKPGVFPDIYVTVRDVAYRVVSAGPMTINVILNDDPIALNLQDVETKVGFEFQTAEPTTENTVGDIGYYSYDLVPGLSLDSDTGVVSGALNSPQTMLFDLYIGDETDRITSEGMQIGVYPTLRATYPSVIAMSEQSLSSSITPDIIYDLGDLNFEFSDLNLVPDGVTINSETGQIEGRPTVFGTFPGVQVRATDTFEFGVDEYLSDQITINITELDADPIISNIPSNDLGTFTVGSQITAFTPDVIDNVENQPWIKENTVFSINRDIEGEVGLAFNTETGEISGTPNAPIIYDDLVISVSHDGGPISATEPFSLGIQPNQAIVINSGTQVSYQTRENVALITDEIVFDNVYGDLTYTAYSQYFSGLTIDEDTGRMTVVANSGNGTNSTRDITVTVTDEFGRQGTAIVGIVFLDELTIEDALGRGLVNAVISSSLPVVENAYGNLSYSFGTLTSIESSWSANADGTITGSFNTEDYSEEFIVPITVTDDYDGTTASANVIMSLASSANAYKYWRFSGVSNLSSIRYRTSSYATDRMGVSEIDFRDESGAELDAGTYGTDVIAETSADKYLGAPNLLFDNNIPNNYSTLLCNTSACNTSVFDEEFEIVVSFSSAIEPKTITISEGYARSLITNQYVFFAGLSDEELIIEKSKDKVTWEPVSFTRTFSSYPYQPGVSYQQNIIELD